MIRVLSLLARRAELTHEQFLHAWAGDGSSAAKSTACRRYVQYRLRPDGDLPRGPKNLVLPLDGIEEMWIDGDAAQASQIWANARLATTDDRRRAHVGAVASFLFEEVLVVDRLAEDDPGAGMLKRLVPLVRKQSWTRERFADHWRNVHAPILKSVRPGPSRYAQLYVLDQLSPPEGMDGLSIGIDGFSESWFVDEAQMNAGAATPEGQALAADNEVYLHQSRRFFFDEVEFPCSA